VPGTPSCFFDPALLIDDPEQYFPNCLFPGSNPTYGFETTVVTGAEFGMDE